VRKLDAAGKTVSAFGGGTVVESWGVLNRLAGLHVAADKVTVTGSWNISLGGDSYGIGIAQRDATSGAVVAAFGSNGSQRFTRGAGTTLPSPAPGNLLQLPSGHWVSAYRETSRYLAMFDANGKALSAGFGTGGIAPIAVDGSVMRVARQADGKLLVAVLRENRDRILRFTSTGSPDATFGNNGVLELTDFPSGATHAVALQSDGRMLILSVDNASPSTTYVTRLWGD
jgi:hypothetical protein